MKRLARHSTHLNSEADEGSWSISYGDMVTLLLAFFILFFSIDPQKSKESAMARSLLESLAPLVTQSDVSRPLPESKGESLARPIDPKIINELGAELTEVGQKLVVEFPEISFFESGQIELTKNGGKILAEFAKLYVPYAGTHMLNIVGFTDERPLRSRKTGARDNLELSALRAVAAQRHLQSDGIPLDRMRLGGYGVKHTPLNGEDQSSQARSLAAARRIVLVVEPEIEP